jgi:hypothetical protein
MKSRQAARRITRCVIRWTRSRFINLICGYAPDPAESPDRFATEIGYDAVRLPLSLNFGVRD